MDVNKPSTTSFWILDIPIHAIQYLVTEDYGRVTKNPGNQILRGTFYSSSGKSYTHKFRTGKINVTYWNPRMNLT